jgi:PAS domain-containing protein
MNVMSFLDKLTKSGVSFASDKYTDTRTIILTNYIALIASTVVLAVRLVMFGYLPDVKGVVVGILFLSPILLNYWGLINFSRILLCWFPYILNMTVYCYTWMKQSVIFAYEYDSLRIYLLCFACVPYLLLSLSNKKLFIVGLSLPFLVIVFFDFILDFLGVGHAFKGVAGDQNELNSMRTIVAYFVLSGSCYSLKRLVENGDKHNEMLLTELIDKNQIIEKQAKDELEATTARLALATRSAGIGIWEGSNESDQFIWDEQMCQLFGIPYNPYNSDQIIDWRSRLHPDEREEIGQELNQAIQEHRQYNREFRVFHPNGNIRHLYTLGKVYETPYKPIRMVGVCWDVTARNLFEEQLLQSKANLNATINNTTFFIWSIDRNYQIVNINKPFRHYIREQFGLEAREGQPISELALAVREFSSGWIRNYKRALTGESFEIAEEYLNRHFKYSLNPIIENAIVSGVSVFAEETTELKIKEMELREANAKIGEFKLMALRSVMNPHFIFNSLNSIQYFIMENDQFNAVSYLSTFSKLIRSILNNSVHNRIRLTDELGQLKHYVDLELLRFDNKFDFVLSIDDELDVENIEIPSMLIQPYVENAILHGLYNKVGRGTLKVSVKEAEDSVLFEIEDDGVGREAARMFRQKSLPEHKSLGTALTEERLKLINAQNQISFEIIDLFTEGLPSGTQVKIWVKE